LAAPARSGEVAQHVRRTHGAKALPHKQLKPTPSQLLPPMTEDRLGLRVDEHDPPVRVDSDDGVGRELNELFEMLLWDALDRSGCYDVHADS